MRENGNSERHFHASPYPAHKWIFLRTSDPSVIVYLWISEAEPPEKRQVLRVAAETISGVRGVEEHVLPAPMIPAL